MAELSFVQIVHRLVELLQEIQAFRGDARFDDAAIVFLALTRDPGVFFHAVEQTGHIGIAGNHALGDAATENAVGLGAAENAQNVVLCAGEATGLQEVLGLLGKGVGGLEERNEDLVFEKSGFAGGRHRPILVVITTIVKRKISAAECPLLALAQKAGDVLRSVNGTASKCKTFLATATEECCPARGTLAGHFTRRLSPSPMPGKRIQQQWAYLPLKEAVRARNSIESAQTSSGELGGKFRPIPGGGVDVVL